MSIRTFFIVIAVAVFVDGAPMDKYQDSLSKYSKWIAKYGGQRAQRNTGTDFSNLIFVPHRPRENVKPLKLSNIAPVSLRELAEELVLDDKTRNVRDNEVGSVYDYSLEGLLPHKKRKSFPYYGRRRRDTGVTAGWTILDPVTGRQITEPIGTEVQLRTVRRPSNSDADADQPQLSYTEFQDENGEMQPIYKYYKKYPLGYSG